MDSHIFLYLLWLSLLWTMVFTLSYAYADTCKRYMVAAIVLGVVVFAYAANGLITN